jgi:hypothetical protein
MQSKDTAAGSAEVCMHHWQNVASDLFNLGGSRLSITAQPHFLQKFKCKIPPHLLTSRPLHVSVILQNLTYISVRMTSKNVKSCVAIVIRDSHINLIVIQ